MKKIIFSIYYNTTLSIVPLAGGLISAALWTILGSLIARVLFKFVVVFLGLTFITYVGIDTLVQTLINYINSQIAGISSAGQFGETVMKGLQSGGFFGAITNITTGYTVYIQIILSKKAFSFFKK